MLICDELYRETRGNPAQMVKMELLEPLENLEMMEHLETLETKEKLVTRVVMLLQEIVLHVHHPVPLRASKAVLVFQETQADQEGPAPKDHLVKLVNVSLEIVESQVNLVNQVNLDKMVNLVNQVNPADLEMMLASEKLNVLALFSS